MYKIVDYTEQNSHCILFHQTDAAYVKIGLITEVYFQFTTLFFLLPYGTASKPSVFCYRYETSNSVCYLEWLPDILPDCSQYQLRVKEFWGDKTLLIPSILKSTIDVLSALTFSHISPHQFCTQFNALYIKSQMVLRNFPLMRITTSKTAQNSCSSPTDSADYRPPYSKASTIVLPHVDNHVTHSYAL
jgi:hypothetical protein